MSDDDDFDSIFEGNRRFSEDELEKIKAAYSRFLGQPLPPKITHLIELLRAEEENKKSDDPSD